MFVFDLSRFRRCWLFLEVFSRAESKGFVSLRDPPQDFGLLLPLGRGGKVSGGSDPDLRLGGYLYERSIFRIPRAIFLGTQKKFFKKA